ncbi:MAG TPA: hypothetical protein VFN97_07200 [Actinospica sp.]|nr:hypothetical protein [Actinospica sp.]
MTTPHAARPKIYDPDAHPELAESRRGPRPWFVPLLGLIFVVMLGVSIGLTSGTPDSSSSGATVVRYYNDHTGQLNTAAILNACAVVVGIFFFTLLREYLRRSERARPYATVALAGAILFAAGGLVSTGLTFSLTDVPNQLTPGAAQALNLLNSDLVWGMSLGALGTMQIGFGVAFLVGKAFPTWLGWVSIAIGVVSLAGPLAFIGLLATGIWVLIVSAMLYPKLNAAENR